MPDFLTIGAESAAELRDRGSRFVARAHRVGNETRAAEIVGRAGEAHHAARHVCYALRLRDGTVRVQDGGEPSQSAGAPILQAIEGRGLSDVVVVVVRYFGGTKLGLGGLIRAYGGAAAMALDAADLVRGRAAAPLTIRYAYALTGTVMRCLDGVALAQRHGYAAAGAEAETEAVIACDRMESVIADLREATSGAVVVERGSPTVWYESMAEAR